MQGGNIRQKRSRHDVVDAHSSKSFQYDADDDDDDDECPLIKKCMSEGIGRLNLNKEAVSVNEWRKNEWHPVTDTRVRGDWSRNNEVLSESPVNCRKQHRPTHSHSGEIDMSDDDESYGTQSRGPFPWQRKRYMKHVDVLVDHVIRNKSMRSSRYHLPNPDFDIDIPNTVGPHPCTDHRLSKLWPITITDSCIMLGQVDVRRKSNFDTTMSADSDYMGVKTSFTTPHLSGENTHADWQIEDATDVSILKQKENSNLRYSRQYLSELNTSTQSIHHGEMLMSDEEDCNSNYMQHSNSMRGMVTSKNCLSPGYTSSKSPGKINDVLTHSSSFSKHKENRYYQHTGSNAHAPRDDYWNRNGIDTDDDDVIDVSIPSGWK